MLSYIIRRLLLIIPTLWAIITVNFFVVQIAPGGPVEQMLAEMEVRQHRERLVGVVSAGGSSSSHVAILARGHSASQCRRLLDLGAKFAVAENLEASLDLAREVLLKEIGDLDETKALLERFRREYYERIDTEADEEARYRKSQA